VPTKLTEYVETAEAAEILGVAQNTLRKWAAQGKLSMLRNSANGCRLFRRTTWRSSCGRSNRVGASSQSERK
jgi:excisionase family DNA binding protein